MRGLHRASSRRRGPITSEPWRRSGYIDSVKVLTSPSSNSGRRQTGTGELIGNTDMYFTVKLLGVLFGLLAQVDMLPVKVSAKRT